MPDSEGIWADPYQAIVEGVKRDHEGAEFRVAGEIECFIEGADQPEESMWESIGAICGEQQIPLESIGLEETRGQYEFRLKPTTPYEAAVDLAKLIAIIKSETSEKGFDACFDPVVNGGKTYNGMHVHVHMVTEDEQFLFIKKDDQMTRALRDSLGGLVASMNDFMLCFAPSEASYERLNSAADHVPSVVSWGGNNRTVALRMPESVVPWRHIEHRVPGADADPFAAIWAVIVGIDYGLRHEPDPGAQMYGRASDEVYGLPKFPTNRIGAEIAFSGSEIVAEYITEPIRRSMFVGDASGEAGTGS